MAVNKKFFRILQSTVVSALAIYLIVLISQNKLRNYINLRFTYLIIIAIVLLLIISVLGFSYPTCNPQGESIALLAQKSSNSSITQALILDLQSGTLKPVFTEHNQVIHDIGWSPDGKALAFTSFRFGEAKPLYETWYWHEDLGKVKKIGETFRLPVFLP